MFDTDSGLVSLADLMDNWPLTEPSGARASLKGQHPLTDNNTVTGAPGPGQLGLASQFTSGNSEYLSCADTAALSGGDVPFAIVATVWLDTAAANMSIVTKGVDNTVGREYTLVYNFAALRFRCIFNNGASGAAVSADALGAPVVNTWYHIVCQHDPVTDLISITVNRDMTDTAAYASGIADTIGDFRIGSNPAVAPAAFWNGRIAEVSIYKRLLNFQEISWLYNNGNFRKLTQ